MSRMTVSQQNRSLANLLQRIGQQLAVATRQQDLLDILDEIGRFGRPLTFNYSRYILVTIISVIIAVIGFAMQKSGLITLPLPPWIHAILPLLSIAIWLIQFVYRRQQINRLQDQLFYKNVLLDNHLQPESVDGKRQVAELGIRFADFQRGNHLRELTEWIKGQYNGNEHSFTYHYYVFHYVNKRTVTYVTSDGKGRTRVRTRTVYDHFHRYGITLPFHYVSRLRVAGFDLSALPHGYRPASNRFNEIFKVSAHDQLAAAKFCSPKVVESLLNLSNRLNKVNLEFDASGQLCLSFADSDLLQLQRRYGFDQPALFADEIRQISKLDKLQSTLVFIEQLMKYTDNNFQ